MPDPSGTAWPDKTLCPPRVASLQRSNKKRDSIAAALPFEEAVSNGQAKVEETTAALADVNQALAAATDVATSATAAVDDFRPGLEKLQADTAEKEELVGLLTVRLSPGRRPPSLLCRTP